MEKKDFAEPFLIAIGVVFLTLVFYPSIERWFWLSNDYEAATLTSSLIIAIVTAIYVRYTYRIFDATNKNTTQTANTQKIAYLERRLEKFYLPMKNFLAIYRPDVYIKQVGKCVKAATSENEIKQFTKTKGDTFLEGYQKLITYSYLTDDETLKLLNEALSIFNEISSIISTCDTPGSEIVYSDEDILTRYKNIQLKINNEISLLKEKLEQLVNQ